MQVDDHPGESVLDQEILHKAYAELRDRFYRLQARREYSLHELRQKLSVHDEYQQLHDLLDVMVREGKQSDRRYAEQIARTRVNAGKGPRIIEQELNAQRIDGELIREILQDYQGRWAELAETVRRKKFGDRPPADYQQWTRQARFLQQRGFFARDIPGPED